MVEYHVMLKRYREPDVCIFRDEDRKRALEEMRKYDRENGFSFVDRHGHRFTIRDIVLMEKEPIVGAPILSETSYHELFLEGR